MFQVSPRTGPGEESNEGGTPGLLGDGPPQDDRVDVREGSGLAHTVGKNTGRFHCGYCNQFCVYEDGRFFISANGRKKFRCNSCIQHRKAGTFRA